MLNLERYGEEQRRVCFFVMIRRPPRSTLFPYTTPLPIYVHDSAGTGGDDVVDYMLSCEADLLHYVIGENERSEEHTSELQSRQYLACRLLLENKKERGTLAACDQDTRAPRTSAAHNQAVT